jgi:spore maturation protein SpmB
VYFGAVGIQRAAHGVSRALLAEFAGVVAAIAVCYWFFGAAV